MRSTGAGKTRIVFHAPSRGLIGYHGEFMTDTRGTGVMNRMFHGYAPYKGTIEGRRNGVLISTERRRGRRLRALVHRRARQALHRARHARSIKGMIIGENARDNDLDVNPLKSKQLTNIRTHVEGRSGAADADRAARRSNSRSPISRTTSWSK